MCRGAEAARLSAEDRTRSSEDRKIAQETRVRTQRSFKFVLYPSPTPLVLPLIWIRGLAGGAGRTEPAGGVAGLRPGPFHGSAKQIRLPW